MIRTSRVVAVTYHVGIVSKLYDNLTKPRGIPIMTCPNVSPEIGFTNHPQVIKWLSTALG